jgi:beta-phosphoglucomutase-like phosphatase (HAD superfamily)
VPQPGVPRAAATERPSRRARRSRRRRVTDRYDLVIFDCDGVLVDSERAVDPPRRRAAPRAWLADDRGRGRRALGRPDGGRDAGRDRGAPRPQRRDRVGRRSASATSGRSRRSSSRSTASPTAVDAIQAAGVATCVASSGGEDKIRRNLATTGPARALRATGSQRRRRRARQAGARSVPPRGRGDGRRTDPDGAVVEDSAYGVAAGLRRGWRCSPSRRREPGLERLARARRRPCSTDMRALPGLLGVDAPPA